MIEVAQVFTKRFSALLFAVSCCFAPGIVNAAPAATKPAISQKAPTSATININSASPAELTEKLIGVGPKKAEAIVAWRKANKGFKSAAQLMEVKGIGPSLYEKNKSRLRIR